MLCTAKCVKRDPYICQNRPKKMSKETHTYEKRPLYMQRDTLSSYYICAPPNVSEETHTFVKRDPYICQKRPIHLSKETHTFVKRDPYICQKRPIHMKWDLCKCQKTRLLPPTSVHRQNMSKRTHTYHKRPIHLSKETHTYYKRPIHMKRDLEKRSINYFMHRHSVSNEPKTYVERNPYKWKET